MTPQSRTPTVEIQGTLPVPLSVPDHLQVIGPMNVQTIAPRDRVDPQAQAARDEVLRKIREGRHVV